jgi:hypothetical protein
LPVFGDEGEPHPVLDRAILTRLASGHHHRMYPGIHPQHPLAVRADRTLRGLDEEVQTGQPQRSEVGVEKPRPGLEGRVAEADKLVEASLVRGQDGRFQLIQGAACLA